MPATLSVTQPDLTSRPFRTTAERTMAAPPRVLCQAWTEQFDRGLQCRALH
jgi:hypothetical protein